MASIINKIIISILLFTFTVLFLPISDFILPFSIAIAISCFMEYFNSKKLNIFLYITYTVLALINPNFIVFIPLVIYNIIFTKYQYVLFLTFAPFIKNINALNKDILIIIFISFIIEFALKYLSIKYNANTSAYNAQRDNLVEKTQILEEKIQELTFRQNEEVNLATLNERNRIAREIHDNVGHLLSSSILQTGALIATTKDENTKSSLLTIKTTLDESMNSIRNSVHDLRDTSIDLYDQLEKICNGFSFCDISLKYNCSTEFNIQCKYAVISIIKECLNNIAKHSNATKATVDIFEHAKILQLIVADNGTVNKNTDLSTGMGLESIKQRVNNLNGNINISANDGFRVFISFNKENVC